MSISINSNKLFFFLCRTSNLKIAGYVLGLKRNIKKYIIDAAFYNACQKGNLNTAKWICKHIKNIDITYCNNTALNSACINGNLSIVKWLLTIIPNINNLIYNNAFYNTCLNGQLKIAKYLFKIKPNIIDSLILKNNIFILACKNNNIQFAVWLLKVCPDINISHNKNEAFIYACINNQLNIAKWLQKLYPYLYVIKYDINNLAIPYINNIKEQLWYKRKYALWLSSSISPNKENIFYKIPNDILKEIILQWL